MGLAPRRRGVSAALTSGPLKFTARRRFGPFVNRRRHPLFGRPMSGFSTARDYIKWSGAQYDAKQDERLEPLLSIQNGVQKFQHLFKAMQVDIAPTANKI